MIENKNEKTHFRNEMIENKNEKTRFLRIENETRFSGTRMTCATPRATRNSVEWMIKYSAGDSVRE